MTLFQFLRIPALVALSAAFVHAQVLTEVWAKRYEGPANGSDQSYAVATDANGDVVVTGGSSGVGGDSDYYTAKYSAADGRLIWEVRYDGLGGSADAALAVALDGSGNVAVTGYSIGLGGGTAPFSDIYTAKYSAVNGALLWERRYNGTGNGEDRGNAIAVDGSGNVIVTGYSKGQGSNTDIYTAKYAAASGALLWEKRYNGPGNNVDEARAIAVDPNGNVVITGKSADSAGVFSCYTAKYSGATGTMLWAQIYSGLGAWHDFGIAVAVDSGGNVIMCGQSADTAVTYDFYSAKYAASNGSLLWERRYSKGGASDVAVDGSGNAIVTGYSIGNGTGADYYTAKYSAGTGALLWEQRYDGPVAGGNDEFARAVALDSVGNVVVTGTFQGVTTGNGFYTAKYSAADGGLIWGKRHDGGGGGSAGYDLVVDARDNVVVTGYTSGSLPFANNYDYYTVKLATPDAVTDHPTLTSPATNAFINNTVNVSFSLPEAALPGSVTLTFEGSVLTRALTLAASQETAGAHAFSFDAGSPAAAAEVESGLPLEYDGPYTVTLSYRDALGNPAETAMATNVTLDTQPPVVGGNFAPLLIAERALPDYRGQATGDAVSFSQSPAPGTVVPAGTVTVYVDGTDAAGNVGHTYFYVRVVPAAPERIVLGSKGAPVPGAGVNGSGIPAGAVWSTFGVPSINDNGQAVMLATYKVGAARTAAILSWALADPEDMMVIARKGDAAPGIANAVFSLLKEPLLGPDGAVAWIATLTNAPGTSGAVDTAKNAAIFLDPDGAGPLAAFVVAQKGAGAAGAAVWKSFSSVALGRNVVAFTGMLETNTEGVPPGPGGATTLTDSGLWVHNRVTSTTALVRREGDAMLGSAIKAITALVARPGSPGQGNGLASDGMNDFVLMRVKLADGRQAIAFMPDDFPGGFDLVSGRDAIGYGAGAKWESFGIPAQASLSAAQAFIGTVKNGTGTATAADNVAIFAQDDVDYITARIVAKGDAAPGCEGTFAAFKDPLIAGNRSVAFMGTMKTVPGVTTAANNDGIWYSDDANGMRLAAREGTQPPEAPPGAQWKAFTSLALPDGRGPIFVAAMHSKTGTASPGPGGITTANDMGLWATDSFGALRLLIREGDAIGASTVRSFTVLSNVPGSPAQTRSFNKHGSVIVRVTDTTGAQHLLHIAVP